ncbi:hypothetical protein K491DRAFT_688704 [Lophiostoma macrostomum CBS 122681]|uniref:Uncharacterized protein n=1 Tax=Lophiostoma macrostomum CBS 122681 TaxID=1314788 RepID=A0A6A6TJ83_9PLEO|nr:hypothetical protein K491DRAFT_688704 [Lophiostoma macrostomum CBS 122681]
MGALLSLPQSLLNFLLPFTDKSTPLYQDLIHTAILCGTLYFAPQIADLYNARRTPDRPSHVEHDHPTDDTNEIPIDENFVLQPDEDEPIDPPPLAPTPPPDGEAHQHQHQQQQPQWAAQQQPDPNAAADALPIPAANEHPRPTPANRPVGTKKAKSLARKDQRRAYFEFHRQEAELARQRDAVGREEREAALSAEKARRAEAERAIAEREHKERERKREQERAEAERERGRRERVVARAREVVRGCGAVDLRKLGEEEGRDGVWAERLVRASGLLGQVGKEDGVRAMITEGGWLVRIDEVLVREAYAKAVVFAEKRDGRVTLWDFGKILERDVLARAKDAETQKGAKDEETTKGSWW